MPGPGAWDCGTRCFAITDIDVQPLQHEKCSSVISFYHKYATGFSKGELSLTMRRILEECNYMTMLERASKDDDSAAMRKENVEEILRGLEMYETRAKGAKPSLAAFLQELSLVKNDEADKNTSEYGVRLMTIHKSKGLEFPVVFLCNLDDALMPSCPNRSRRQN